MHSTRWIIAGDFNAIRFGYEGCGGSNDWPQYMNDFNDCCIEAELEDLNYTGMQFTWGNNWQDENIIYRKIDRVIVNESWYRHFRFSNASF